WGSSYAVPRRLLLFFVGPPFVGCSCVEGRKDIVVRRKKFPHSYFNFGGVYSDAHVVNCGIIAHRLGVGHTHTGRLVFPTICPLEPFVVLGKAIQPTNSKRLLDDAPDNYT
ncbi:unnamed protein product, partial [Scytosiphon promiscuus]